MESNVKPYQKQNDSKKKQVTRMFDGISKNYDRLNRIITFGIDVVWRKRAVGLLIPFQPENILDIATGTGDLAIALTATGAEKIIGLDISPSMLEVGKKKILKRKLQSVVELVKGDSENLQFEDDSFDAVTVAFGVRNFEDLNKGLQEIKRVLRSKGRLVILETAMPKRFPIKQGYRIYSRKIMPFLGRVFSKDKNAYQYLSNSATCFPSGETFNNILRKNGFIEVEDFPQTLGVSSIYNAKKP